VWFSLDGPPSDAQLWHDPRPLDSLSSFTDNITVPGSFQSTTDPHSFDPLVRGSTDNFSDTVVIPTEVPEPSSLLLLGLGIGGLYRRVRRR
jgi:PEP-CTERM motif